MRAGFFTTVRASAPAVFAAWVAAAVLLGTGNAQAYCLTTTCDTLMEGCGIDEHGCSASGIPLQWPSLCLYYGVQQDGSSRLQFSADTMSDLMVESFHTWMNADCGSGNPPFVVQSIGEVACHKPEFNCDPADHNSNTVMFRDDVWHYDPAALAITTLTVDVRYGTILDADMEVNSVGFTFSVGDSNVNNDLLSVLTHESGHFLGLSHSNVDGSTMYAGYSSRDTSIRSLSDDDLAGICEIYPPDRTLTCTLDVPDATECIGGSECRDSQDPKQTKGCRLSVAPGATHSTQPPWLIIVGLSLLTVLRRRRSVSH